MCFRPRTTADDARVAAFRSAHDLLLAVPRYHRAEALSVAIRVRGPELDGPCGECEAAEAMIVGLLEAYPEPR